MVTTLETQQTAKFVHVRGVNTRYFDLGSGEPMVLLHGSEFANGGSASTWQRNFAGLSSSFHVYAIDRLGQGFTDNPLSDDDYTIEAVMEHVHAFVQALGLRNVHIVGQSRGAYVAARYALEHPEIVRTLVVVNSATLSPEVGSYTERRAGLLADAPRTPREEIRFRWGKLSWSTEHITDDYLDEGVEIDSLPKTLEAKRKMATFMVERFLPSLMRQKEETLRWIEAGRLQMPTLLYWGYNDPLAPLACGLALLDIVCARVPYAQMHIVNHAGHFSYREQPEDFDAVVTEFVRGRRGRCDC